MRTATGGRAAGLPTDAPRESPGADYGPVILAANQRRFVRHDILGRESEAIGQSPSSRIDCSGRILEYDWPISDNFRQFRCRRRRGCMLSFWRRTIQRAAFPVIYRKTSDPAGKRASGSSRTQPIRSN